MMGGIWKFTVTYPALIVVRMLIYNLVTAILIKGVVVFFFLLTTYKGLNYEMIAYINVFTRGIGYSHWKIDLGFTLLPKYEVKRMLAKTMSTWFIKGKNVYAQGSGRYAGEKIKILG